MNKKFLKLFSIEKKLNKKKQDTKKKCFSVLNYKTINPYIYCLSSFFKSNCWVKNKYNRQSYFTKRIQSNKKTIINKVDSELRSESSLLEKKKRYFDIFLSKNLNIKKISSFKSIEYSLDPFHRSNQDTCLIHKLAVNEGDWVQPGDLLADCSASVGGELALGHNILVAYMPWEGFNYEDAILLSERLVFDDIYTSVHIERYEIETQETKIGKEIITRDIPDVNEKDLISLDKNGIIKLGTWVEEGDILVGKITPISQNLLSDYQKLLVKLFEKDLKSVKDSSLRAPKGIKSKVIKIQILKYKTQIKLNSVKSFNITKTEDEIFFKKSSILLKKKNIENCMSKSLAFRQPIPLKGLPLQRKEKGNKVENIQSLRHPGIILESLAFRQLNRLYHNKIKKFEKRTFDKISAWVFIKKLPWNFARNNFIFSNFFKLKRRSKNFINSKIFVNQFCQSKINQILSKKKILQKNNNNFDSLSSVSYKISSKNRIKNIILKKIKMSLESSFPTYISSAYFSPKIITFPISISSSYFSPFFLRRRMGNPSFHLNKASKEKEKENTLTSSTSPTQGKILILTEEDKEDNNMTGEIEQTIKESNKKNEKRLKQTKKLKSHVLSILKQRFTIFYKTNKKKLKLYKNNFTIKANNFFQKNGGLILGFQSILKKTSNTFGGKDYERSSYLFMKGAPTEKPLGKGNDLRKGRQKKIENLSKKKTKFLKKTKVTKIPTNIHIYLAEKRKIQVGDKMAGRHGNKGIISLILPRQDMPFLPDGTPVDIVLNPLGVPSRMNVGQIYECLLGLAGKYLGEQYKIFPFDEIYGPEASRSFVYSKLYEARKKTGFKWLFNPSFPGKIRIYDGRYGEPFDQSVTVGRAYMLKLVHMVDDKLHSRSTGPYSLVTQQPLRGRSKMGGQRLGEMEVWAIEGYGAAFTLLEMLTIKSDDMNARQTLWSSIIFNKEISIGTPEAFNVLVRELQALCLDIGLFYY